jgi:protein SCO1/2
MQRKTLPIGSLILFGLFLLLMLTTWLLIKPPAPPAELAGVLRSEYRALAPFELNDHNGRVFDETSLRGKWSLIFFGYLSCPDICPLTMHELSRFWNLLQDQNGTVPADPQIVFVSVDPGRDTPQQLANYIGHFNSRFVAATANQQQLDNFASQFGAGYVIEDETAPGQYLVAHTSAIFVVDPLGRSVATFSQPHHASTLLAQFRRITDYFSGNE